MLYSPSPQVKVTRRRKGPRIGLIIQGAVFNDKWKVSLDQEYAIGTRATTRTLLLLSPTLLELDVEAALMRDHDRLIIVPPDNQPPILLAIPREADKPGLDRSTRPLTALAGKATTVEVAGWYLGGIKSVRLAATELAFATTAAGDKLTVLLDAASTRQPGRIDLALVDQDGNELPLAIFVAEALTA